MECGWSEEQIFDHRTFKLKEYMSEGNLSDILIHVSSFNDKLSQSCFLRKIKSRGLLCNIVPEVYLLYGAVEKVRG